MSSSPKLSRGLQVCVLWMAAASPAPTCSWGVGPRPVVRLWPGAICLALPDLPSGLLPAGPELPCSVSCGSGPGPGLGWEVQGHNHDRAWAGGCREGQTQGPSLSSSHRGLLRVVCPSASPAWAEPGILLRGRLTSGVRQSCSSCLPQGAGQEARDCWHCAPAGRLWRCPRGVQHGTHPATCCCSPSSPALEPGDRWAHIMAGATALSEAGWSLLRSSQHQEG